MADFRKLRVWQAAHELGVEVERVARGMRHSRARALCDQMSRSAMSISANIAEGSGHESPREFARYLQYAIASTSETEAHIRMARDINSMSYAEFENLMPRVVSVRRQLCALTRCVRDRAGNARLGL